MSPDDFSLGFGRAPHRTTVDRVDPPPPAQDDAPRAERWRPPGADWSNRSVIGAVPATYTIQSFHHFTSRDMRLLAAQLQRRGAQRRPAGGHGHRQTRSTRPVTIHRAGTSRRRTTTSAGSDDGPHDHADLLADLRARVSDAKEHGPHTPFQTAFL